MKNVIRKLEIPKLRAWTCGAIRTDGRLEHGEVETWTHGMTLIAAYPPAQTEITQERYYSAIIKSLKYGELIHAVDNKDVERVKSLIASGVSIDAKDSVGQTALRKSWITALERLIMPQWRLSGFF